MFRDGEQETYGLTPAQIYNKTFGFGEVFILVKYYLMDNENGYYNQHYRQIENIKKYEEYMKSEEFNSTVGIQFEKIITHDFICYNFKHPQDKTKRSKITDTIYTFILYHHKNREFNIVLSSKSHSNNKYDNLFKVLGDKF